MTLEVFTDLKCDAPGCQSIIAGIKLEKSNSVFARQRAAKFGWVYRFYRDYCPKCASTVGNTKRNPVYRKVEA